MGPSLEEQIAEGLKRLGTVDSLTGDTVCRVTIKAPDVVVTLELPMVYTEETF